MKNSISIKTSIILLTCLFLTACATKEKFYPLKTEDVRSYRLKDVNVVVNLDEEPEWTQYTREKENIKAGRPVNYKEPARYEGLEDEDDNSSSSSESVKVKNPIVLTEEELEEVRIVKPLKDAFHSRFGAFMVGSKEVNVNIEVKKIRVAKANGINTLVANYELVDAMTETPIIRKAFHTINFQAHGSAAQQGFSLAEIVISAAVKAAVSQATKSRRFEQMSDQYALSLRDWMAPNLK